MKMMRDGMIALNNPSTTENIKECERLLSDILNTTVLLTPSCTAALEMAALLLDIQPGDEVIMPSFTFPSTANAFMLRGGVPVFCDIRPDTLNIDEQLIGGLITERTKAIVPVHYAGVACEMDTILGYGWPVVEDNAHGLLGTYKGNKLGTIGELGALSFHYTKNFSCDEGGALLINDPKYIERAHIIRDKGTNRRAFMRGEVVKYTWVDLGGSYTIANSLAEMLYKELDNQDNNQREFIFVKRRELAWRYWDHLDVWAKQRGIVLPTFPKDCTAAHHIFWLVLPTVGDRVGLQAHLTQHGIQSATHYQPLHLSPMNKRPAHCPVTEDISQRLLRLPLHHNLSFDEQAKIIEAVMSYGE